MNWRKFWIPALIMLILVLSPWVIKYYMSNLAMASIHKATEDGDLDTVEELILDGQNVNKPGALELTPLHIAAGQGDADMVGLLLDYGAKPNAQGRFGHTPLHAASRQGDLEVLHMLLEAGALVIIPANGETALDYAEQEGHEEAAALLLEYFHQQAPGYPVDGEPVPPAAAPASESE